MELKMFKIIKNLIFILSLILGSNTFAQNLVVDITEGNIDPLPIAIQKFVSEYLVPNVYVLKKLL